MFYYCIYNNIIHDIHMKIMKVTIFALYYYPSRHEDIINIPAILIDSKHIDLKTVFFR